MAAITKTPSNTWKAIIRKRGWPTNIKTFRTKRVCGELILTLLWATDITRGNEISTGIG